MTVLMSALGERAQGEGGGAKETAERHPSGLSTGNDPFGQRPENFSIVTPTSADTHFESSRKLTNDESKVESAQPFDVHNPSCSHDDTLPSGEVYIQEAMDKLPKRCLLCRGIGTPSTCGSLVPVRVNGEEGAVHHACAVWAPQVYESEDALGVKTYNNLDSEWTRSQSQPCTACFALGAAVSCAQPGCQASYHLPCAVRSTDVILNKETFELWCPKHSILRSDDDQDMEVEGEEAFACSKRVQRKNSRPSKAAEDDEDFCPYRKPRRSTVSTTSRRHRFQRSVRSSLPPETSQVKVPATLSYATSTAADNRVQRPRTDWQRHGNVWVKVVPPWWAEHRTIHFANKVFRELFCGTTSVILVDQQGCHWDCKVNCETRNDLRLQFTLSGQFTDYWDSAGITSGDVLTFERDNPDFGKIRILRYPQGQGLDEALFGTQAVLGGHQYQIHPGNPKEATKGPPSLEHRWIEGQDGAVMRVLNRVEIAQGQCSLAAGVFQKLYDRPPEDLDTAPMMDTTLGRSYIFQVSLIPGFEDHCITGPAFSSWLSDASMVSGDGLKVWKVGYQVLLCRVAANDVHHMLHSSNGRPVEVRQRRSTSLPIYNTLSTKRAITNEDEGKKNSHGQTPTAHTLHNDVELQALHTLAAAANYAGLHGTPAIHSVLSHAADMKALQAQGIEEHLVGSLKDRLRAAGLPPPPSPLFKKARNDTEIEPSQQVNDVKLGSDGGSSETVPNPNFAQTFPQAQLMFPQRVQPSIVAVPGNLMTVPHPHFHFALQQQTMMNQFKGLHQHHHHHQHQQPQLQPPQQQSGAGASTTDNASLRIAHSSSPKEWQPSQGATAFAAILSVLGKHNWSAEEMGLILKFRAKYVVLDAVGREVAFLSIMQFQNDKNALVEMLKGLLESNHAVDVATSEHIANLPPTKIE